MNIHGGGGGGGVERSPIKKNMGGGGQDEKIGGLHEKNHWGGGLKLWAFHVNTLSNSTHTRVHDHDHDKSIISQQQ